MIHRHIEIEPRTAVQDMPLAALQDLLERGDLCDWRPLLKRIQEAPTGELSQNIARLVDVYPMYGTSPLIRAWIERCSNRKDAGSASRSRLSLAELRRSLGKTQIEVAEAMGMSQSDYSKLERRKDVRVSTLRAAAAALGGRFELRIDLPEGGCEIEIASDFDEPLEDFAAYR